MPKERDVVKILWQTFVASLKPKRTKGDLKGHDSFGNKYFEIPADPSVGKRKDARWFEPTVKDKYDQELPAEWEAWLRGRRKDPPTQEELMQNQAIADMKKVNAAELEKVHHPERVNAPPEPLTEKGFPKYDEYEMQPGQNQDKDK